MKLSSVIGKILILAGSFLLIQFIVSGIMVVVFNFQQIIAGQDTAIDATNPTMLLTTLAVSNLLIILIVPLVCETSFKETFSPVIRQTQSGKTIALCCLVMIPLMLLTNEMTTLIGAPDNLADTFKNLATSPWAVIVLAVLGPMAEEVCFRHGVTGSLLKATNSKMWVAVVISALIFGLAHLNPAQMINAFLLGLFLAWIYAETGSLWPSIICHILNNAISVALLMTFDEDFSLRDLVRPQDTYIYIIILLALAILVYLLITILYQQFQKTTENQALNQNTHSTNP